MNIHDACEEAYKRGYERGRAEANAEIERLAKEVDRLSQKVLYHDGEIADAQAEAIKEFIERVKGVYSAPRYDRPTAHTLIIKLFDNIDQIAKEMGCGE